jgi:photosystem II stability/assembly factor-like uncharacterized protein
MKKIFFIMLLGSVSVFSFAQKNKKAEEAKPADAHNYNSIFSALKWRNIGPFRGGRANAICGVPGNDQAFFVGYTGGGVSKTEDGGLTWRNVSDGFFKVGSIGDIAVADSDPNVVYVGTGEHAVRGVMTSYGDGVYKSVDGGRTWKNMGLQNTRHISDVVVHPTNSDIVYVAAQGAVHGPSSERGIFKSTDGGVTWRKVLYVDENSGASSLSIDKKNPRILYAATWQHRRHPWMVESGGPGSSVWKSIDGGETWNKINTGLPAQMGKIGVSVSYANPNRVFAIVEAEKSKAGLYRSDNGGMNWTMLSNDQLITARSWYYMEVFADPKNENVVYVLNAPLTKSIDGGKTFAPVRVGHGDTHDFWINPNNPDIIGLADDGGGEITYNGCRSWSSVNNQPTAQFYRVNVDNRFPYWVYGGQQDNTSVMIQSRTNSFGITEKDWAVGPGCESAWIAFDPNNPVLLYGGCYQGYIDVLDTKTKESKDIQAYPSINLAIEPKKMKYRFNWNAPIVASPHDPSIIYHAANVLLKTTNGGINWEVISPDLTRNDSTKQGLGGGPITNEGAGGENYNTIYYVIESSLSKGEIWTGSDCGLVNMTTDGGISWSNVTPASLQECMINSIELSPHDKGTAYISATRYKFNDFASYTFKTTDFGKSWIKIATGVDADDFIRVIREDKKVKGLLYGGSERGFYISYNGGMSWSKFQLNLPVVPITDMILKDNDIVVSTAGRSFWILDDVSAVQQVAGADMAAMKTKLFTPKPTYRYSGAPNIPGLDPGFSNGQNPVEGVMLDYYLPENADTNVVKLEVLDAAGKLVRTYTSKKDETFKPYPGGPPPPQQLPGMKGVNRFAWNFKTENVTPDIPNAYVYGDYTGQRMPPGKYKAKISYKDAVAESEFDVIQDPNLKVSKSDWDAQQQFIKQVTDEVSEMHKSILAMRKVKKQVELYNEMLKDVKGGQELIDNGKELVKKIDEWEGNVIETRQKNFQDVINFSSKLNVEMMSLKNLADTHDPRVTKGIKDRKADLDKEWMKYKAVYNNDLRKAIDNFSNLFKTKNLPAIIWEMGVQ